MPRAFAKTGIGMCLHLSVSIDQFGISNSDAKVCECKHTSLMTVALLWHSSHLTKNLRNVLFVGLTDILQRKMSAEGCFADHVV